MGGEEKIVIPDYKQYKIEGLKQLEWTRDRLKAKGLKDPWIRNEAWRFTGYPGIYRAILITFSRGFRLGMAGFILTIGIDKAYGISEGIKQARAVEAKKYDLRPQQ